MAVVAAVVVLLVASGIWLQRTARGRYIREGTGRPGPSTWELGSYPEGKADEPVRGVSWYEAAAYAEFAGKNLPTVYHRWRAASDTFSAEPGTSQLTSSRTRTLESSQKPLFQLLGTPAENKRHVLFDMSHAPPRNRAAKESLNRLDEYLGPVEFVRLQ